jgi:hypothetical protein
MRKLVFVLITLAFTVSIGTTQAFAGGSKDFSYFYQFQWLRDADGDGIPNCLDDDWERPQDGTGYGIKNGSCLPTDGVYVLTADEKLKTQTRKEKRHGEGNPDAQHDRDRLRDGSCQ